MPIDDSRVESRDGQGFDPALIGFWDDSCFQFMQQGHKDTLVLNNAVGWESEPLDFLESLPWLRELEVLTWTDLDVSPINSLTRLEDLNIELSQVGVLDYASLKNLKSLAIPWGKAHVRLAEATSLRALGLSKYKSANLGILSRMSGLETLRLFGSSIESLDGLQDCLKVKSVMLVDCRRVKDYSALYKLPHLTELHLHSVLPVGDLEFLRKLPTVKSLALDNVGPVPNLEAVLSLKDLEWIHLAGTTVVMDGNISCLDQLPKLEKIWMDNKRHYDIKRENLRPKMYPGRRT